MTTPAPVTSGNPALASAGRGVLELFVANAEALWRAFAAARGHRVIDEPGWLAVDAGGDIGGTRVILRRPVTGAEQCASLSCLLEGASGPVVVEDPYATIDLRAQGFTPSALAVMGAGPFSPDAIPPDAVPTQELPGLTVRRVDGNEGLLREAERTVVEGFPLSSYQPYRPGQVLPAGLLTMSHVSVFVADHRGESWGACMTVKDQHGVGGVYWVAVLPDHRRAGVGRALMLAAVRELAGMPMVLCATSQGAPLYRQLGFETALESTYWRTRSPA